MTYSETVQYLYDLAPSFQHIGVGAYKEGLDNTVSLDKHLGHPHRKFRTIHIAGTNGKGSTAHTLAAILQTAGYHTGLYTSPHLTDFRERIRVDGKTIPEEYVVKFVEEEKHFFEQLKPSFFEITTALAFNYFAWSGVDVAVIETGLGGRLDCTNIINPIFSVITNISLDHTGLLGNTLPEIAAEKAGIIKPGTPVVIGETNSETLPVFRQKAQEVKAPVCLAEEQHIPPELLALDFQLKGIYQAHNKQTILACIPYLEKAGFNITTDNIATAMAHVCELTGLQGRWQLISHKPDIICDTGHNPDGIRYIARQLQEQDCRRLRIIFGMMADKDVDTALSLMPTDADYYFTQAGVKRAMPVRTLWQMAAEKNLRGTAWENLPAALEAALRDAQPDDLIFVGGSTYIVAELLETIRKQPEQ